jgi:hypothetical protein
MTESFFDLFQAAKRIGECVALEDGLFTLFGGWSTQELPTELSVLLHVASRSHGELSEAFAERLPVSASIENAQFEGVSSPLGQAAKAAIDAARTVSSEPALVLEFIISEVIPAVEQAYNEAFFLTSPHCDGPFRVVLDRALSALEGDLELLSQALNTLQ